MQQRAPLEHRQDVIWRYLRRVRKEIRNGWITYVDRLADLAREMPPQMRPHDIRACGDVEHERIANRKKLERWMSDSVSARPSMEVEEILVQAMPPQFAAECRAELTLRHGGLFVLMPVGGSMPIGDAATLLKDCGEALVALAPLLADGQIDESDSPAALLDARRELLDVGATVQGLIGRIDAALDQRDRREATQPLRAVK